MPTVYTQAEVDTLVANLQAQIAALGPSPSPAPTPSPTPTPTPIPTPTPSPSASGVAAMTPGQWTAVNKSLSSVVYSGPLAAQLHANTGPDAIMSAWGGAAFDTDTDTLIVWGGGHTDYHGNEVYTFNLDTLAWALLTQPDNDSGYGGTSGILPNGNPASLHAYDGSTYVPGTGFFQAGGATANLGDFANNTWKLDLTALKWLLLAASPGLLDAPGNIAAYDAATKTVVFAGLNGIGRYTPGTNAWAKLGNGQLPDYHMTGAIDPVHNQLVAVGNGFFAVVNLSTGAVTRPTTTGDQTIFNANAPGFDWYGPGKCFVGWNGGKSYYTLDPTSWAWTAHLPASGDTPTAPAGTGTFGRFRYSANLDAFVGVNAISEPVFILKGPLTSTATQPAPSTPTNLVTVTHASGVVQSFPTLAAAQAATVSGDVVAVSGGTFNEGFVLNGGVTLKLLGVTLQNATVQGGVGLIASQGAGNQIVAVSPSIIQSVHNGDGNGSGVRQVNGDLTISGPLTIQGCDMGVLSGASCTGTTINAGVVIQGCGENTAATLGHNLYLQGGVVTFKGISRNAAFGGHEFKCRAPTASLVNATLQGDSGDNSRLIDMANGGSLLVTGCTFIQGPNTENTEMIGYAGEGLIADGRVNHIDIENNTITTTRPTSTFLQVAAAGIPTILLNNACKANGNTFGWGIPSPDPSNTVS